MPEITAQTNVGELIDRFPGILEVLEEYGIRMDPFTYLLLRGSVQEAAEYSAVADLDEFRSHLADYISSHPDAVSSPLSVNGVS